MNDSEQTAGLSRRTFIEMVGFSAAAAIAAGCERSPEGKTIPYLNQPVEMTPGKGIWYASTCGGCSSACGILVKVRDGRPIKIEGNSDHPLSRGGICAVAQASLASLYDSDRLREPIINGQAVPWEKLDADIARRLLPLRANGSVRLLTQTLVSPTSRMVVGRFLEGFADARHIQVDPISYAAIREGHRRLFGKDVIPGYQIQKARLLVGIEADLLGSWLSPMQFTRARADRRAPDSHDEPLRHIQFESRFSLTGGCSDRRVQLAPREVAGALLLLGQAILDRAGRNDGRIPGDGGALRPTLRDAVLRTADELWKERGKALLIVGVNDPDIQELAATINQAIGAYGATIDVESPSFQYQGDERNLDALIDEMNRGAVGCLVIWGANPVYNHPRGMEFAEAMKKVATTIAIADRNDETASRAAIVAASHHWLESWGDAEPVRGTLSLLQPAIAPLFRTRGAEDSLLKWAGDTRRYYDVLREEWRAKRMPEGMVDFGAFWEKTLHDGGRQDEGSRQGAGAPESDAPEAPPPATTQAFQRLSGQPSPTGLDLVLYEKVGLRDGQHGNNPLLHEFPDPVSRVSWGNYALIAPSTARRIGVEDGRVVTITRNGASIDLPARVLQGTPPETIAIPLGYGRSNVGRVGNGLGANAFPLMARGEDGFLRLHASGVAVAVTDRRVELAMTQVHDSQEGRNLVRKEKKEGEGGGVPGTSPHTSETPAPSGSNEVEQPSLWPSHPYTGHRWGMTVDLNACVGCGACVIGCQVENNVPVVGPEEMTRWREMHWIRIDRYFDGPEDDPTIDFQPIMCVHCENASCESVCPVIATAHSSEGLNMQVYNRCVGTRYCANNCVYKVRRFNWFDYDHSDPIAALALNPDVTVRTRGVMEKCSLCVQRIEEGKINARNERRPLVDGEILPACAQSCPAQAITFGDMADPKSRVARKKSDRRNYVLLDELNLRPVVSYLAK